MEFFKLFSNYEITLFAIGAFTLVYQIVTWLSFAVVATHKHKGKLAQNETLPEVSIIIVMGSSGLYFIEQGGLQKILEQNYDGNWEVVAVNDCAGSELTEMFEMLAVTYPHFRFTELKDDLHFKHSRKIPLLVGIKSAKYENIVIADTTAAPESPKWLAIMARGFIRGSIVIGYTGFVKGSNIFIRASRFYTSLRYLRSAVMGHPYRGIYNNIGYTKESFFSFKGYTHLRLALGEDDLFIQKIAPMRPSSIMLNPHATMRQEAHGIGWWWNEERYRSYAFKFYPFRVRFWMFVEMLLRLLFFGSVALVAMLPYPHIWAYALGAFVLRELLVIWSARRTMRRLGEKRLMPGLLLYDIIEPITAAVLSISRRVIKPKGVWK